MKSKFEIQTKILNIDDVNLSSRIFLYFLVSKFIDTRDNNIEINLNEIRTVIGYGKDLTLEVIMNLKLKDYIKIQKHDNNKVSLSTKTLAKINKINKA